MRQSNDNSINYIEQEGYLSHLSTNWSGKCCITDTTIEPANITVHHCFLTFSRTKSDANNTEFEQIRGNWKALNPCNKKVANDLNDKRKRTASLSSGKPRGLCVGIRTLIIKEKPRNDKEILGIGGKLELTQKQ